MGRTPARGTSQGIAQQVPSHDAPGDLPTRCLAYKQERSLPVHQCVFFLARITAS